MSNILEFKPKPVVTDVATEPLSGPCLCFDSNSYGCQCPAHGVEVEAEPTTAEVWVWADGGKAEVISLDPALMSREDYNDTIESMRARGQHYFKLAELWRRKRFEKFGEIG